MAGLKRHHCTTFETGVGSKIFGSRPAAKKFPRKRIHTKSGSVVQWLALWTLNPAIRVQVSAEPWFLVLLSCRTEGLSRTLNEFIREKGNLTRAVKNDYNSWMFHITYTHSQYSHKNVVVP